MKWGRLLLLMLLCPGCVTAYVHHVYPLHIQGRLVSCVTDQPLEGVTVVMHVVTDAGVAPRGLQAFSDSSGAVDAEVQLHSGGRERWWLWEMRSPESALEFEFILDMEGYEREILRLPASGVKEEEGIFTLELGQVCLEPSLYDDLFLYTRAQ